MRNDISLINLDVRQSCNLLDGWIANKTAINNDK